MKNIDFTLSAVLYTILHITMNWKSIKNFTKIQILIIKHLPAPTWNKEIDYPTKGTLY